MFKKIVFLSVFTFAAAVFASDDGPFAGKPAEWRSFSFYGATDVIPYKNFSVPLKDGMTVLDLKKEFIFNQYRDNFVGNEDLYNSFAFKISISNEDIFQPYDDTTLVADIPESVNFKYDDSLFRDAVGLDPYKDLEVVFTFKNKRETLKQSDLLKVLTLEKFKENLSKIFNIDINNLSIISSQGATVENIQQLKDFSGEGNFKVIDGASQGQGFWDWLSQARSWFNRDQDAVSDSKERSFEKPDAPIATNSSVSIFQNGNTLHEDVVKAWQDDDETWQ